MITDPTPVKSTVIFKGRGLTACHMRDGSLVVQRGDSGGVRVTGPVAGEWARHIRTAMDGLEAASLCRALLSHDG